MKIALKESKVKRLEKILKNNRFFIVCNNSPITTDNFLRLSQGLLKFNLYCFRINNKLFRNVLKHSIFNNYVNSISGPIMLVFKKSGCKDNKGFNFSAVQSELKRFKIDILGVCLNYKIYSSSQLSKFIYFDYNKNMVLFYNILKIMLIKSISKFIKYK